MISEIFDFCQKVNFELNLYELIKGLSVLLLTTLLVLIVNKIVCILKKERKIDQQMRETRARIARVVTEIEEFKYDMSEAEKIRTKITQTLVSDEFVKETLTMQPKIEDAKQMIDNADQNIKEGELSSIQEVLERIPEGKKTRAMSMEERWAEFDKKRSIRDTA